MNDVALKKRELIHWGAVAYEKGFVAGASGNLSLRLDERRILVTPSGVSKGRLRARDLIQYDVRENRPLGAPSARPSSEIRVHAFIYRRREDVRAVLHAHPVYAVALSAAGVSLEKAILPESIFALGRVASCPYATPTTEDVVAAIEPAILSGCHALILERHGSITLGSTMEQAYLRLETLEHVARVAAAAHCIGKVKPLPQKEIQKIEKLLEGPR